MSKEKEYSIVVVIAQVCTAAKYADISEDLVRSIALKEMIRKQPIKDTVKAVRNKLHQIGSAFQETTIPYEILFRELQQLPGSLADAETQAGLKRFMQYHTSTRERLPIVDHFFQQTLASIAPITSVLDIASAGLSARNRLNSSGDNETGYLAPLQEIARSGVVSAQRLLDLYNGPWGGDLTRVYEEHF